jgi:glucosamine--fructose-6-phosphate aminotransferase (isomerizing)
MCGIIAFAGNIEARTMLIGGLERLEYRGYDSAGVALVTDGGIRVIRKKGKVSELAKAVAAEQPDGMTGIGHTRWATHGVPSEGNAHPHCDCAGRIAIVHNGIIENHACLRNELAKAGHRFSSQTDTEVIAHLIEQEYSGDLAQAVHKATKRLSGSFALAAVHAGHPGMLVVARFDSPLVLGSCQAGAMAASDASALIGHTRDIIYLRDNELAVLHDNGAIECWDANGSAYEPAVVTVEWDIQDAQRDGYPDFLLKEIHEQPRVLRDTLAGRMDEASGEVLFDELPLTASDLNGIDRVLIVGCGTSYHAGLIGKYLIEAWARVAVDVEVASEFRYRNPIITRNTLVIAISQSGETADTLQAVRLARRAGAHVLGISNTLGSRLTLDASTMLYIKANIEISVAATKSFLAQVALLTLLALHLGHKRGQLSGEDVRSVFDQMLLLPAKLEGMLASEDTLASIRRCADACVDSSTALFIGRGVGATICHEGALKLKEISYLHAESYSAGEIKHGSIALIDPAGLEDDEKKTPIIAVALQSETYDKMITNIEEVLARGARVIALCTEGDERIAKLTDYIIRVPEAPEFLSPLIAIAPLQLLAHRVATMRGCDIDQPRNLAKSVVVE